VSLLSCPSPNAIFVLCHCVLLIVPLLQVSLLLRAGSSPPDALLYDRAALSNGTGPAVLTAGWLVPLLPGM
jgi:hypothetical protein